MNRMLLTHLAIGGFFIAMITAAIVLAISAFGAQAQTLTEDIHYMDEWERQYSVCDMHLEQSNRYGDMDMIPEAIEQYKIAKTHCMNFIELVEWFCGEYHSDMVMERCAVEMENAREGRQVLEEWDKAVSFYELPA